MNQVDVAIYLQGDSGVGRVGKGESRDAAAEHVERRERTKRLDHLCKSK
jgi:hypothetical protein